MRLAALWILLVAVYAATLGVPAQTGSDYAGNEPHHLLAAESIVSDRDVDLADEYAERSYASWYPGELQTDGSEVGGRLMEPHGAGFALLIAPAYAIGGARAVQGAMLALLALAFVLGAALARRMVPEPWATAGAALVGLSPPALAAATTVTPGVAAAVLLAGAALCALAVRERPRLRYVFGGAVMLAVLPWLGWTFAAPGAVVAWALVTWTLRARRRLAALIAGEALVGSLVFYATINDRFYGGITPRAAGIAEQPDLIGYVERIPRLAALWLDREVGLLRWAPLLALVFMAGWLLYRSRRDQLARVAPARREAEACAALLLGVVGAQVVVVAMLAAGGLRGPTFPGVPLVAVLPAAAGADGVGAPPHPAAARGGTDRADIGGERVARSPRSPRAFAGLAGGRHGRSVGAGGGGVPGLHGGGAVPGAGVRGDCSGRGGVGVAGAAGCGGVAAGCRCVADLARLALTGELRR